MRLPKILLAANIAAAAALTVPVSPSCASGGAGACVSAIEAAVKTCSGSAQPCTVQLAAGSYTLGGAPFANPLMTFSGIRDVAIVGAGADATTLVLSDVNGIFAFASSSNVTLSGFSVDSVRPYFTLGTVVASAGSHSNLTFDAGAYPVDLAKYPWLAHAQAAIGYDPVNDRFLKNGVDDYWLDAPQSVAFLSTSGPAALLTVSSALPVGQAVVLRHQVYSYNFLSCYSCDDLLVSGVTLYATPGMGVFTANSSNVVMDALKIAKRPGRPMSITADGVHFCNSRGGAVIIRNCLFEGQGDDGVNVPTIFQDIDTISADRLTLTLGKNGVAGANAGTIWAGAEMQFFGRKTLIPSAPPARVVSTSSFTVTLDAQLDPGVALYDLVNNAASYPAYVEVTDSVFRANRARGALLKASNVFCARNVFDHCTGPAIKTEIDGCYWFEGAPVRNWTVRDNIIVGVNYATAAMAGDIMIDSDVPVFNSSGVPTTQCVTPLAGPVHYNLSIVNNSFVQDAGNAALAAFSVYGFVVSGNEVTRTAGTPPPAAGFDFGCGSDSCSQTSASGNTCNGGACVVSGL